MDLNKGLFKLSLILATTLISLSVAAADGKLLGTVGLSQLEGSGGGGLVPWATISGYDSDEEISATAFATRVTVDDYGLTTLGASVGLYDRVELSVARQTFDLTSLGGEINQNVFGLKTRLYGDAVYSKWPQISVGLQYKTLQDTAIATAVGADNASSGTDYYLALTKIHLGAAAGYNLVWDLTARATKANQMGLLGFGGINNSSHQVMLEGSVGILLSRNIVIGYEYRQKPDNLSIPEHDWNDFFLSYIPNKSFNLTMAWANLGDIAGAQDQQGLYLSATGYLR